MERFLRHPPQHLCPGPHAYILPSPLEGGGTCDSALKLCDLARRWNVTAEIRLFIEASVLLSYCSPCQLDEIHGHIGESHTARNFRNFGQPLGVEAAKNECFQSCNRKEMNFVQELEVWKHIVLQGSLHMRGLPQWSTWRICLQCRVPSPGKIPWRRKWQPSPVFLPGKFHGQRSLTGYNPWGRKRVWHYCSDWTTASPDENLALTDSCDSLLDPKYGNQLSKFPDSWLPRTHNLCGHIRA